jgi:hypothetical protein
MILSTFEFTIGKTEGSAGRASLRVYLLYFTYAVRLRAVLWSSFSRPDCSNILVSFHTAIPHVCAAPLSTPGYYIVSTTQQGHASAAVRLIDRRADTTYLLFPNGEDLTPSCVSYTRIYRTTPICSSVLRNQKPAHPRAVLTYAPPLSERLDSLHDHASYLLNFLSFLSLLLLCF